MAQNSLKCQFCKISLEVKWKCKTCDVIFCDSCRLNIHAILKNSHEHDVMDFKDTERNCSDNVDLKSIPCSTHLEPSCLIYCRNCDKSLCSSCLIYPSDQIELTRIYYLRRESLDELKQQIENTLPFFEAKSAEFRSRDSKLLSQHRQISQEISDRQNDVNTTLSNEANELLRKLNSFWNPNNNPVTQQKERLETIEEDLKQRREDLDDALKESSAFSIFPVFEKINKDLPAQITVQVKTPNLIYIESSSNDSFFGSIIEIPTFKLAHTFTIRLPDISAIVTLNEETCVLYSAKTNFFKHISISNLEMIKLISYYSKTKRNQTFDKSTRVVDMTAYRGNILIADVSIGNEIMHICHSVSQTEFTSIGNLHPCGVHTAKDNILVGYFSSYHRNDKSGIMILDLTGKEIRRFECTAKNEGRLFTYPAKITTNINNDICVVDYQSFFSEKNPTYGELYTYEPRNGRVVILGEWGQPKWTYSGHSNINCYDNFTPYDIATTMHGHILIADRDSSTIHVVSKNGQFIAKCCHDDIVHPNSLNIDKMGRLLIGCSSDWDAIMVAIIKMMLGVVKLLNFT
ncbi:Hypothetical predicted protein [Mytilus galloprovincialis]|uniref:B box-type domain-containing protein n=1 Tax=Mytilus galloprovincialis TaxID=29158 RepID=A0A8B6C4D6_MYTGA|nr:Hypothetical predicted protein [Mytilus galloprovincialis]